MLYDIPESLNNLPYWDASQFDKIQMILIFEQIDSW